MEEMLCKVEAGQTGTFTYVRLPVQYAVNCNTVCALHCVQLCVQYVVSNCVQHSLCTQDSGRVCVQIVGWSYCQVVVVQLVEWSDY